MKKTLIATFFLLGGLGANAAPSECPEHYVGGEAPDIWNIKLNPYLIELCATGHSTFYSGLARAPLWSAQLLTPERTAAASSIPRSEDFREDLRLPETWRSLLSDFSGSGYDRGHIAPAGDMFSPEADSESFLLSNIIPQDPQLNRSLWAAIERAVRRLSSHRPIYVITGGLWLGEEVNWLRGRVMVPTHVFKLVYDKEKDEAAAYLVENKPDKRHQEISIRELEALAGIEFFPDYSPKIMKLPRPRYQ